MPPQHAAIDASVFLFPFSFLFFVRAYLGASHVMRKRDRCMRTLLPLIAFPSLPRVKAPHGSPPLAHHLPWEQTRKFGWEKETEILSQFQSVSAWGETATEPNG